MNTPPEVLPVLADNIPAELKQLDQWVTWRYTWNDKKKNKKTGEPGDWDKPPVNARTGGLAKTDDPSTWSPYAVAYGAYLASRKAAAPLDGIGFVAADDDAENALYLGDLDGCGDRKSGVVEPWASEVVHRFDTYTEWSPSGTGLRFVCRGRVDLGGKQGRKKGPVELYRAVHYLTMTGRLFEGAPAKIGQGRDDALRWLLDNHIGAGKKTTKPPGSAGERAEKASAGPAPPGWSPADMSDDELLQRGYGMRNGDKLRRLMAGDTSGYDSPSEADEALVFKLYWLTDRDRARTERLFARSALAERAKWRERADYRRTTLDKAEQMVGGGFGPGASPSRNGGAASDDITVGPLTIRPVPGSARRTAAKLSVQARVMARGQHLDAFTLSTAARPRKDVEAWLFELARRHSAPGESPDREAAREAVSRLLAWADREVARKAGGPAVLDVLRGRVLPGLRLAFRSGRGLWSEARGCEVARHDFVNAVAEDAVAECSGCRDAPHERDQLIRRVVLEMSILCGTLMRDLPEEADADDLGPGSRRAAFFRKLVRAAWTAPAVGEPEQDANGNRRGVLTSLAAKAARLGKPLYAAEVPSEAPWQAVHRAMKAWFRPRLDGGELTLQLAMTPALLGQIGRDALALDDTTFFAAGRRYGVLAPDAGAALTDGRPLAVLSDDLAAELLASPDGGAKGGPCDEE